MSKAIRKGDRVLVIAGNDKGKSGEVLGKGEDRILVQGINVRKKHMKPTGQTQGGRIVEMEVPIHISNVCLCDKDGKRLKLAKRSEPKAALKAEPKKTVRKSAKKVKDV